MKWNFWIIGLVLLATAWGNLWAESYIKGEGSFYAHEDDKVPLIKKQLFYSATKDIYSKVLKELGYNVDGFWENYNLKFEEHFAEVKKAKEEETFKEGDDLSEAQRKEFEMKMRQLHLAQEYAFYGLPSGIKKWKISKKMRRAAPRSLLWNITIEATVDRNYINNVYHQMMGRNVGIKVEESLFVILDLSARGGDWSSFGIKGQEEVKQTLLEGWIKKLQELGIKDKKIIPIWDQKEKEEELLRKLDGHEVGLLGENLLRIKLDVEMGLKKEGTLFSVETKAKGGATLWDLASRRIIWGDDFAVSKKKYNSADGTAFKTPLLNELYRLVAPILGSIKKKLATSENKMLAVPVNFAGIENVQDADIVVERLQNLGLRFYLKLNIEEKVVNNLLYNLLFIGDRQELFTWFESIKGQELANGYSITDLNKRDKTWSFAFVKQKTAPAITEKVETQEKDGGAE